MERVTLSMFVGQFHFYLCAIWYKYLHRLTKFGYSNVYFLLHFENIILFFHLQQMYSREEGKIPEPTFVCSFHVDIHNVFTKCHCIKLKVFSLSRSKYQQRIPVKMLTFQFNTTYKCRQQLAQFKLPNVRNVYKHCIENHPIAFEK